MKELKIGLIGLDTSHVIGFGNCYNRPEEKFSVPGLRIVRAYPGGSAVFSLSRNRLEQFTRDTAALGVEIVDSIDALGGLDAYLLESVDGTQHLEQFEQLAGFGKPVFIDKPLACNYADAKAIFDLASRRHVPIMTASSMRYVAGIADLLPAGEKVLSAEGFGPMAILEDYRDYFWYGIHTAEIIYKYLGCGCVEVHTESSDLLDLVIGRWADGRMGMLCGNRAGSNNFGVRLVTDTAHRIGLQNPEIPYMYSLAESVAEFFRTGVSPIDPVESLEVIAFLEAASRSRAEEGCPIRLAEL